MAIGEALKARLLDNQRNDISEHAILTHSIGVARDRPFRQCLLEMIALSLGVAELSFAAGSLVGRVPGVDV